MYARAVGVAQAADAVRVVWPERKSLTAVKHSHHVLGLQSSLEDGAAIDGQL